MKSVHEPTLRAHRIADLFAPATVVLFAGCGGSCIGIEQAYTDGGYTDKYVDLAINHWDTAVGVHALNHPMTQHMKKDVREVDPDSVLLGRDIAYLWASPDCTHFSKARGSKPKRKEIRGLAWVVIDWAKKRRPTVITLENVEEFTTWGPLARDGQPCPRRKGHTFKKWKQALEGLGYVVEHRELRAMEYGAPTTRKRLFVVARCDGKPIIWPERTHGKLSQGRAANYEVASAREEQNADVVCTAPENDREQGLSPTRKGRTNSKVPLICDVARNDVRLGRVLGVHEKSLKPFRTAAECIDWSIPMLSIFSTPAEAKAWTAAVNAGRPKHEHVGTPRRPLKDKTLKRIAGGLVKWVLQAKRPFIVNIQNYGWNGSGSASVDQPMSTITAGPKGGGMAAVDVTVAPVVTQLAHGGEGTWGDSRSVHPGEPIGTVHAGGNNHALVNAVLAPYTVPNLGEREGQAPRSASVEQPAPTITSKGNGARLVTAHLATLNHGGDEHRAASVEQPLATITGANDARALVSALITKHYTGVIGHGMEQPIGTVTGWDHHSLTVAYLSQMYGTNAGTNGDLNAPAATVTGTGNHATLVAAFLDTYYGNSKDGGSPTDPMPTVVSKDRISLVTVIIDGTTYVITDIAMRMLTPRELLLAQGFPADYRVDVTADGTRVSKADQVKLIGNSVSPPCARAIAFANVVASGVLDDVRKAVAS